MLADSLTRSTFCWESVYIYLYVFSVNQGVFKRPLVLYAAAQSCVHALRNDDDDMMKSPAIDTLVTVQNTSVPCTMITAVSKIAELIHVLMLRWSRI